MPTCNPFGAGVPLAEAVRHRGLLWFHTCLNLLHTGRAVQQLAQRGRLRLPRVLESAMLVLGTALVLLGVVNATVAAVFGEPLKGRMENVTEWWGALIFVLGFFAIAALWRRERVVLRLGVSPP